MAEIDSDGVAQNLLWVDLEMTGLVATTDLIVEVALVVTDYNLTPIKAQYQSGVYNDPANLDKILAASVWHQQQPPAYLEAIRQSSRQGKSLAVVEKEILDLIDRHFDPESSIILAGNSIRTDRAFIDHYWPQLGARCHYRMLDVSAWKVYLAGRFGLDYQKQSSHRAIDDIKASIAELDYYINWFKGKVNDDRPGLGCGSD